MRLGRDGHASARRCCRLRNQIGYKNHSDNIASSSKRLAAIAIVVEWMILTNTT
jgi:hypothetical protein